MRLYADRSSAKGSPHTFFPALSDDESPYTFFLISSDEESLYTFFGASPDEESLWVSLEAVRFADADVFDGFPFRAVKVQPVPAMMAVSAIQIVLVFFFHKNQPPCCCLGIVPLCFISFIYKV